MRFENIPMLEGYEVAGKDDKTIYLLVDESGHLFVLKVFKRTYKYPLYESLSKLTHINMPKTYETFLAEDCFYVLEEFIEGKTLQEMLETDGVLDTKSAIDITLQLCDVLTYLHNQSSPIIHRDITPANVMVTRDGVVKLLDFDISREHKKEAEKDTEIFGTKPFAPPEQYGFSQSDHRTDIYSLGVLMTVMLTNTYDSKRIKSRRIKAAVKQCTAFDPKKRYEDTRVLKNRVKLCVSPLLLLSSVRDMDTNIYVFPNTRLKVGRMLLPIIVLYFSIIALSFIQPYPENGAMPKASLLLFTIIINPQRTANDTQYKIFYVLIFAIGFTFLAYVVFAIYDITRFYYLKVLQRYYLKQNPSKEFAAIPFVIASKRYAHCTMTLISCTLIILSIPFTDAWSTYDIHGVTIFIVMLCCLLSCVMRGARYPKCYNKATRCYYKGDIKKAVRYAEKSSKFKGNHAIAWLAEILRAKENQKAS